MTMELTDAIELCRQSASSKCVCVDCEALRVILPAFDSLQKTAFQATYNAALQGFCTMRGLTSQERHSAALAQALKLSWLTAFREIGNNDRTSKDSYVFAWRQGVAGNFKGD